MKKLAITCGVAAACYAGGGLAAVQVKNVRTWAAPDNTRVVFDLTAPTQHRLKLLDDPFRVVIDVDNARMSARLTQPAPGDRFLLRIRNGAHEGFLRFVLDLRKHALAKSRLFPPNAHHGHRLVVDVSAGQKRRGAPPAATPRPGPQDVLIMVDAGHGGEDPGASGPRGLPEKTAVLQISKKLAALIDREPGMRPKLTRYGDYYLPLRKRVDLAHQHQADLFISIHADAFHRPQPRGSSVYVLSDKASSRHAQRLAEMENAADRIAGVDLEHADDQLKKVLLDLGQRGNRQCSIGIAEMILGGLGRVGGLHKTGVEAANFAVLKTQSIPSVLVETAFISNPQEEKKLRNAAYQQQLAAAIHGSLKRYFSVRHRVDLCAPRAAPLPLARRHTIRRGDTLSEIAGRYQVSMRRLMRLNGLSNARIRTGETLTIPAAGDS